MYVAYYRVSTDKQSLGLDAQKTAVENYIKTRGGKIVQEYTEKESGSKTDRDRPQLKQALDYCAAKKATLIIAKLDRLARNVRFLTKIMDSKVQFVACDVPTCDNPATTRMIFTILMSVAETELEQIRDRTKKALAERKKQIAEQGYFIKTDQYGNQKKVTRLGAPNAKQNAQLGTQAIKKRSMRDAIRVCTEVKKIKEYAVKPLREIAKELQARGVPPITGNAWIGTDSNGNVVNKISSLRNIMIKGGIYA